MVPIPSIGEMLQLRAVYLPIAINVVVPGISGLIVFWEDKQIKCSLSREGYGLVRAWIDLLILIWTFERKFAILHLGSMSNEFTYDVVYT